LVQGEHGFGELDLRQSFDGVQAQAAATTALARLHGYRAKLAGARAELAHALGLLGARRQPGTRATDAITIATCRQICVQIAQTDSARLGSQAKVSARTKMLLERDA
jgi:predicted nucleic acid-binding protein